MTTPMGIPVSRESVSASEVPFLSRTERNGETVRVVENSAPWKSYDDTEGEEVTETRPANSHKTSSGEDTHLAEPSRMSELAHKLPGRTTSHGTANTSFQKSSASLAVMRLPDFSPASVTSVPSEKQATKALRMGKW